MLTVKKVTNFNFTIPTPETTFNFSMPAETQSEAASKLIEALKIAVAELAPLVKAGVN
jgi:hypothetical protein